MEAQRAEWQQEEARLRRRQQELETKEQELLHAQQVHEQACGRRGASSSSDPPGMFEVVDVLTTTRTVAVQSQTTYKFKNVKPMFKPLPEYAHGADVHELGRGT